MKTEPKPVKKPVQRNPATPPALPAYPVVRNPASLKLMLVIAGFLVLLYFVAAPPLQRSDGVSRSLWGLTAALASQQTLSIDHFVSGVDGTIASNRADFPDAAYYQGHYYSDQPPGVAFLGVPAYQLGMLFGEPAQFGLAFVALMGAGVVLAVYGLARRLGCAAESALYGGLMVGFATLLWREAGRFAPPIFSILFLALALWLALPPLPRDLAQPEFAGQAKIHLVRGFALGLTLGYAVVIDYSNAVWFVPVLGYVIWQKRAVLAGWFGIVSGAIVGVIPLLAYNTAIFGRPWNFSYGFVYGDEAAHRFSTQFFGGGNVIGIWRTLFGEGRAFLGLFVIAFGIWGLLALWGQRGKREITGLLFALLAGVFVLACLRYTAGSGAVQADYAATMILPLALGTAVWHERYLFLTRLETNWVPLVAVFGLSIHYFINWPWFPNFSGLIAIWPLYLLLLLVGFVWRQVRSVSGLHKALALSLTAFIFGVLGVAVVGQQYPVYAAAPGNNLIYNPTLKAGNGQTDGWFISTKGNDVVLQPYLLPVQGGKAYNLSFEAQTGQQSVLGVTWRWDDEAHQGLSEISRSFTISNNTTISDGLAAPPGAAYLQLTFITFSAVKLTNFTFGDNSVRLEPMKNYATAALAFSFDWESAMGGLIHSRGGAFSEGEAGGTVLTGSNEAEAVRYATERGLAMREGADNLLQFFQKFNIRATWYATGYNLLDGNTDHRSFASNPTYRWAGTENRWGTDYWRQNPWYKHDPFGTFQTDPAWYFGDQTDRLAAAGQEIASHTFGHLYVKATRPSELDIDLREWQNAAQAKKLPPARTFAFPWQSSNSLGQEHYNVLYDNGFSVVTRLNNADQNIVQDGEGNLYFGNAKPSPTPSVDTTYFYLTQPRYAPKNGVPGAFDNRFILLHDYQLLPGEKSEATATRLIDELVRRRGSYGSIWTHPEAVTNMADRASWLRVITYAANARANGLWVDTVEALTQFRRDVAQVGMQSAWSNGGQSLKITLTNPTDHALDGLTLTMPRTIAAAPGAVSVRDAQLIAPTIPAGGKITLEVRLA